MERLLPGGVSELWLRRFSIVVVSSLPMELAWVLAVLVPVADDHMTYIPNFISRFLS